jgi:hypothetical protein
MEETRGIPAGDAETIAVVDDVLTQTRRTMARSRPG